MGSFKVDWWQGVKCVVASSMLNYPIIPSRFYSSMRRTKNNKSDNSSINPLSSQESTIPPHRLLLHFYSITILPKEKEKLMHQIMNPSFNPAGSSIE